MYVMPTNESFTARRGARRPRARAPRPHRPQDPPAPLPPRALHQMSPAAPPTQTRATLNRLLFHAKTPVYT